MPKVVLKENEVLDDALRRFKRQVSLITLSEDQNGILDICRFDCLSYRIIAIFNIDAYYLGIEDENSGN